MTDSQAEYERIRRRDEQFSAWRRRATNRMPELAARVFALRTRGYRGCGFHWGMEKQLGYVLHRVSDYDTGAGYYHGGAREELAQRMLRRTMSDLFASVVRAERGG